MKKTEQLTISPITGRIYWADVRPIEGDAMGMVCVGEKRDVTDEAIKAVYHHFLMRAQGDSRGVFGVRCDNGPWLRIKLHEEPEEDA